MAILYLTQISKTYSREKTTSSVSGYGKIGCPHVRRTKLTIVCHHA